jgi:hypothetical protein
MMKWFKSLSAKGHSILTGVGGIAIGFATILGAQSVMHGSGNPTAALARASNVETSQASRAAGQSMQTEHPGNMWKCRARPWAHQGLYARSLR